MTEVMIFNGAGDVFAGLGFAVLGITTGGFGWAIIGIGSGIAIGAGGGAESYAGSNEFTG